MGQKRGRWDRLWKGDGVGLGRKWAGERGAVELSNLFGTLPPTRKKQV
jgi:hypothetical protein